MLLALDQFTPRLDSLRAQLKEIAGGLHLDDMERELQELHEEMNADGFWDNLERSTHVNRRISNLEGRIKHYHSLLSGCDDVETMIELANEENDESMVEEISAELERLEKETEALSLETLMRGKYDDRDAVLSLHAGAGGTEAQDWTSMLYRMYTRYCERMGFTVKLLDLLDGDEAGIKSVTFEVSGDHAYGYLRGEKGVHRLVRISPFDANARRHTSFASLDVAPMLEDDDSEIEIDM
ncbi:MAG: PCRF domain-containing protein, partial [Clostridia bacterium]|nr:PCRF domain-containing protein [Clostridia bacterium]